MRATYTYVLSVLITFTPKKKMKKQTNKKLTFFNLSAPSRLILSNYDTTLPLLNSEAAS